MKASLIICEGSLNLHRAAEFLSTADVVMRMA